MKIAHGVADGSVYCSLQGKTVDVMGCYGCDRVVTIDLDSRHPKVVCVVPEPGEPGPAQS
jgi:hypothetical protein